MNYRNPSFNFIALSVYLLIVLLFQGYYQYNMDTDSTAYLTISERIARGEYFKSINGLWSPLNEWLLAPFIKMGFQPWPTVRILNFILGGVALFFALNLIRVYTRDKKFLRMVSFFLPVVFFYFTIIQPFGDILQMIFIFLYFILLHNEESYFNTRNVFSASLLMGLAYYAKSYTFFFFLTHLTCMFFLLIKKKRNRPVLYKNYIIALCGFVLCIVPWVIALYNKYHTFTWTGHAGKLNLSWFVADGKHFRKDIKLLIPPTYHDSPSFWEDPYLSEGNIYSPLSSIFHFYKWMLRIAHTSGMYLLESAKLSVFYLGILFSSWYFFLKEKVDHWALKSLILGTGILPAAYLTMHIEARYLWASIPWVIILAYYLFHRRFSQRSLNRIFMVFLLSFVAYPVYHLYQMAGAKKDLFHFGQEINGNKITRFTSNYSTESDLFISAYISHTQVYSIEQTRYNIEELVHEMRRYHLKYYIHFPTSEKGLYTEEDLKKYFAKGPDIQSIPGGTLRVLKDSL